MILLYPAFAIVGVVLLTLHGRQLRHAMASRRWPQQPATVVDSYVITSRSRYGETSYCVRVTYECAAAGTGPHVCILPSGLGSYRRAYAERLSQFFRPRATVPAYVDPRPPHTSILLPGVDPNEWIVFGVTLVATLAAIAVAGWSILR